MSEGPAKEGTVAQERIAFLIEKPCRVRVWWNEEGQAASPGGDCFEAILLGVFPVGRDYYFSFLTGHPENPKRSIIKTAAVLQISEV
jgi:hypothetical protein